MENEQELYIYPRKIRNFAWFLVALFASVFLIWNVNKAMKDELLFATIVLIILSVCMIVLMMIPFKWMTTEQPYLTLTDETITIRRFLRRPLVLKWEHILNYQLRDKIINRLVEITVYHEDFSGDFMTGEQPLPTKTYTFSWGQIASEDRKILAQQLDSRALAYTNLYDTLYKSYDLPSTELIVNKKYWMVSYSISLAASALSLNVLSIDGWKLHIFIAFALYFILYPFAKVMLDVLARDMYHRKQDQIPPLFKSLYSMVILPLHILVYALTIFIAPIGIIYVIVTIMRARKASG